MTLCITKNKIFPFYISENSFKFIKAKSNAKLFLKIVWINTKIKFFSKIPIFKLDYKLNFNFNLK